METECKEFSVGRIFRQLASVMVVVISETLFIWPGGISTPLLAGVVVVSKPTCGLPVPALDDWARAIPMKTRNKTASEQPTAKDRGILVFIAFLLRIRNSADPMIIVL
jgi:hypothetical protein